MKKALKIILLSIVSLIFVALIVTLIVANYKVAPYVTNIEIKESKRFEDKVIFNIEVGNHFYKFNKETWCYLSVDKKQPKIDDADWKKASQGYCSFTISAGDYNIYVKDKYGNITDVKKQKIEINKVLDIKLNKNTIYLYKKKTNYF